MFLSASPPPYLIKLIQSSACMCSRPHYLWLSGLGWPPTQRVCCHVVPMLPTGGAADPCSPSSCITPAQGRRTAGGGITGLVIPPHTQDAQGVHLLHSFSLERLNIGSRASRYSWDCYMVSMISNKQQYTFSGNFIAALQNFFHDNCRAGLVQTFFY